MQRLVDELVATAAWPAAPPTESCAVVHVRRADTVLNFGALGKALGNASRRCRVGETCTAPTAGGAPKFVYLPLSRYVERVAALGARRVALLTDDQDVIDELPDAGRRRWGVHWHYLRRPRHRGAAGGWEAFFPSGNRSLEVAAILAARQLATACDAWVGTKSSFGGMLRAFMPRLHEQRLVLLDATNRRYRESG